MRLFVTGAAGFIGSNYVHHVLETSDDEVTVFDALTYAGNLENLADVEDDPRFTFVKGNITDRDAVTAAMDGHDAVVHFAAESHVDRSIASPDEFVHTNCDGTNVMCDVARHVGVDRFLHISTDEVYGSIEEGSLHRDATRSSPGRRTRRPRPARTSSPCRTTRPTGSRCSSPARRTTSGRTSSPRRSSRCSSPTSSRARRCRSTATA